MKALGTQCESELKEIVREVNFDVKFSFSFNEDNSFQIHRLIDRRRIWDRATNGITVSLLIADLFVPLPLARIALVFGGISKGLGKILFKDYEKKVNDARRQLQHHLESNIEKRMHSMRKSMFDALNQNILKSYMYPMIENMDDAITSLFTLSDIQYEFAGGLRQKLKDINQIIISEALNYNNIHRIEPQIENIARIPGHAVIIGLKDGDLFPEDATKSLRNLLKERIRFVFLKNNIKSVICQSIGREVEREYIKIQTIKDAPRIAHISNLKTLDAETMVRVRLAQQLTGLLIMD